MGEEYKVTTKRNNKDYMHSLTYNGKSVDSVVHDSLETTLDMIKLNHIMYLTDSPEIDKLETRITIKK